ncbi:MAG: hypothetical protein PWP73_823 [Methanococcus sp.]|jgi:hypothetical protein|nr:hypothetical protein [Methanococcus sp.]
MDLDDKIKFIIALFFGAILPVYIVASAFRKYTNIDLGGLEPLLSSFDKLLSIILNLG